MSRPSEPSDGLDDTLASAPARLPESGLAATVASAPARLPESGLDATVAHTPSPTVDPPETAPSVEKPNYAVLQQVTAEHYAIAGTVARGGMGRILRARDRRLGREVAIKELLASSPQLAARFEREIRITARLQHPSIVTVHEAGTWANGEPFFTMELVAGRALDEVTRDMTNIRERLGLVSHVIAVADALAYAHSKGVIHRDLKPANVLVGEFGETVVIDWGLAKDLATEDDAAVQTPVPRARDLGATQHGAIVGTPAFMPPEQACGHRVDERADVYSIGAMLYAVLSGRPPYTADSVDRLLDRVIEARLVPLTTIEPEAPPDLVAIVNKAMARRPENRYPDARELAKDLRRFQTGQMVGARSYTLMQRLRRFIVRNRVLVSVVGVAAVVLAVVSTVTITRIIHERDAAEQARVEADVERARAEAQRTRANEQRTAAEGLVGFMLSDLKPQLGRVGRLDIMRDVAMQVDGYYGRLVRQGEDMLDGAATDRRATALHALGDVLFDGGESAAADRAYQAAIALETGAGRGPDAGPIRARAQSELAASLIDQGELDRAAALADGARTALEAMPNRSPEAEVALATAYRRLAIIAFARGHHDDAIAQLAHCIDHARRAGDSTETQAGRAHAGRKELAKCHDRYSDVESARNNRAGAEHAAREGLAIRQQLVRDDPGDLEAQFGIVVSWDKLYVLAIAARETAKAKAASDEAIAIVKALVQREPNNVQWSRMLAEEHMRRADMASNANDAATAARIATDAVAIVQRLADHEPNNVERIADLADMLGKLGEYHVEAHQLDAGLAALRRGLAIAEKASAAAPANTQYRWGVATIHEYVGDALKAKSDFVGAATEYAARLAIDEDLLRAQPAEVRKKLNVASTRFLVGDALAHQPKTHAEGVAHMKAALDAIHALKAAGQLSPDYETSVPEMEAILAKTK